jgi:type II pantothenate kinase
MLPLARELLKRGVAVIMAANERPSINDITAAELGEAVRAAAAEDKVLGRAWSEAALRVMSNGSDMPVIDLSRVRQLSMSHIACKMTRGPTQ